MSKLYMKQLNDIQNHIKGIQLPDRYFLKNCENNVCIEISVISMSDEDDYSSRIEAEIIGNSGNIGKIFNMAIFHDMFEKYSYRKADYTSNLELIKRDETGKEVTEAKMYNCIISDYMPDDNKFSFSADYVTMINNDSICPIADKFMKNITNTMMGGYLGHCYGYGDYDDYFYEDDDYFFEEEHNYYDKDSVKKDIIHSKDSVKINNLALLYL